MDANSSQTGPTAQPLLRRRGFFRWITYGVGGLAAIVLGLPLVGYLFGRRKPTIDWISLGSVDDFPIDETRHSTFKNPLGLPWDGMVAHVGVFVRNQGKAEDQKDRFLVLVANCAHLGCPVSWFPQSGLFMCPCHGGVYYASGERASGPPPRGLFACTWRVRDGRLEIQAPHYPTLQDTLETPA